MEAQSAWQEEKKTEPLHWELSGELYGREKETKALREAYSRRRRKRTTTSKPEFVLITGVSGCGKSALARSIRQRAEDDWGFFVSGKFDQDQVPHAPFIAAVEQFIRQVALRGELVVQSIRDAITEAIGPEVFVLLEVIPRLEDIVQSNNSSLANLDYVDESSNSADSDFKIKTTVNDNNNRFTSVFCRFIRAICSSDRPVVLLLDDVQWADHASLQILKTLLDPVFQDIEGLMLVGTCRGNEVALGDELSVMLREVEDSGTAVTDIQVSNLGIEALSDMLSATLELSVKECVPLAEIVHSQTGGNAFFTKQYVRNQLEEGTLWKDSDGKWTWDEAALLKALPSKRAWNEELVIQLLAKKLQQLPAVAVETMKVASCLGSRFSEGILFHSGTVVSSQVLTALQTAEEQGFIYYDFDLGTGHFMHDKMREAAYSLISEGERDVFHLNLGRNLRRQLPTVKVKANIFVIVNQIKHGLSYVEDADERDDFARLFLRASREVAKTGAFLAGLEYIDLGIGLLSVRNWRDQYELSLDLYSTGAELGYCTGSMEKLDEFTAAVSANAWNTEDMMRVKMAQVVSFSGRGFVNDGIAICLDLLKALKEPFPTKAGKCRIQWEFYLTKRALRGKTEEDILSLPKILDPRIMSSMQVIFCMFPLLALSQLEVSAIPAFRLVRLTLKHGLSPLAGIAFNFYAVCLTRLGEYDDAYRFAQLANTILDRYQSRQLYVKVKFMYWVVVCAIKEPLRTILKPMWDSHRMGMKTGDIEIAMAASTFHAVIRLFLGDPIPEVFKDLLKAKELCATYNQLKVLIIVSCSLQLCHNLRGGAKDPLSFTGEYFNEEVALEEMESQNLGTAAVVISHFKFVVACLLNDNESASSLLRNNKYRYYDFLVPFFTLHHTFFKGLVSAAFARDSAGRARRKHAANAAKNREELMGLLIHCPDNVISKIHLIDAELEFSRPSAALIHYKKAMAYAQKGGFLIEQALACEKAGAMLLRASRKSEDRKSVV